MRLLLVHLSDIHFKSEEQKNPVLTRVDQVVNAAAADHTRLDGCVVIVSGDISFSGRADEFKIAKSFLSQLKDKLEARLLGLTVDFVVAPGNHDCNFAQSTQVRDLILDRVDVPRFADGSAIEQCTSIQQNYFDFAEGQRGRFAIEDGDIGRLHRRLRLTVGQKSITFHVFNSAWLSKIREEPGSLTLPVDQIEDILEKENPSDLSISVAHHPYNWFKPENGRGFRGLLEKFSDVIVTGHEHVSTTFTKTLDTGEQNEYLEGGVLQDHEDDELSSFNAVLVDTEKLMQQSRQFRWLSDEKIYEADGEAVWRAFERNKRLMRGEFEFSSSFRKTLDDPGANFTHPVRQDLSIRDIFVYPDLRENEAKDREEQRPIVRSDQVLTWLLVNKKVLLVGEEKAGKTALAKTIVDDLKRHGKLPLLLSASKFNKPDESHIKRKIEAAFRSQYRKELLGRFHQLDISRKAIVIDDFHKSPLNKTGKDLVVSVLAKLFDIVVVLAGEELHFEELKGGCSESSALLALKQCEILELGHVLRNKLITKWYTLGREYTADDEWIRDTSGNAERQINEVIGSDLVPSHPVYILILLHQLESTTKLPTATGSFGYLYQVLVTACLSMRGSVSIPLDTKYTYLTELAYHLFASQKKTLSEVDFTAWHGNYCNDYQLDISRPEIKSELVASGIIEATAGGICFKYPYSYYFFVGRYFSSHIGNPDVQGHIENMSRRLHQEEAATVMLFLCHLSKDPIILKTMFDTADSLLAKFEPCDLVKHVQGMNKLCIDSRKRVLGPGNPAENRERVRQTKDELQDQIRGARDRAKENPGIDEALEISAAFKTIQILGQILRNFVGSLKGDVKLDLVRKCNALGLRTLTYIFVSLDKHFDEIAGGMTDQILKKYPNAEMEKARSSANRIIFGLMERVTLGTVKHVSNSIGTEQLSRTFKEVSETSDNVAIQLIDLAVKLDHYRGFPKQETLELSQRLEGNPFALAIVRDLVWFHFYLFERERGLRQSICAKLKISIQGEKKLFSPNSKKSL